MSLEHPPIGLLRNVSTKRIVQALERDGFQFVERKGSQRVYHHENGRFVVVHYHKASDTLDSIPFSVEIEQFLTPRVTHYF
ncbi:MAG: type II toxin-antitoxin system HicA family toxin [Nitrospinae bacterium]|nr:type II toxin-antitoxin system HicA family toxin [Nitrospinota bacterium]